MMLPYLRDRPIVLTRYPDGIAGKSFFQKDAPEFARPWVRTERVHSRDTGRDIEYFVVDQAEALRYVANLGTIPIHAWSARVPLLERPDWLVLDPDPKGAPFTDVVRVAQAVHRVLDELELPSHMKTSGATGLHVLVPLGAQYTTSRRGPWRGYWPRWSWRPSPESPRWRARSARGSARSTSTSARTATARPPAAPFSVRPLPGAPVSCPLEWREVTARLDPAGFTIRTVPARFARRSDPLRPGPGPRDRPGGRARASRGTRRSEEAGRRSRAANSGCQSLAARATVT
jgi:bifunctional non-homologous end joining protein LigD